ncbi:MAG: helix-turn-helix domain-containing protein [Patescibacteria group bacterium]|nr:helix-turn-helix domain-containing protein [Patescibacteria group bacterium]
MDYGLSEKETLVYLATLKLEVATAQEIAKIADVNRSSTYVVLETLTKKGLVGISDDNSVRRYVATSPEVLAQNAKNLASKQENIKEKIVDILPELKALHKDTRNRPRVKIFEGANGIMEALEDTLGCRERKIRIYSAIENVAKLLPRNYFVAYVTNRLKRKISMSGIHPDNETSRMLTKTEAIRIDKPLLIQDKRYKFPADLAIYDDKIGYMSGEGGGLAIIIESPAMAETMKNVFDLAWERAEDLVTRQSGAMRRSDNRTTKSK